MFRLGLELRISHFGKTQRFDDDVCTKAVRQYFHFGNTTI